LTMLFVVSPLQMRNCDVQMGQILTRVEWFSLSKFSKCILCYFAYFIGLDVHLLQIQIYSDKVNHRKDILHSIRNYLYLTAEEI